MSVHQHFKLYKPAGYLSQFVYNQNRRKNKKLLAELGNFPEGTMSVGRLDEKTEGLLFLTTDGMTSFNVLSKKVEKEYYVQVEGSITKEAVQALEQGVEISVNKQTYLTLPAKAFIIDPAPEMGPSPRGKRDEDRLTTWVSITINEGKFRQVRKMTAAVGFPTLRLVRVRIGKEVLGAMRPGDVIKVQSFSLE